MDLKELARETAMNMRYWLLAHQEVIPNEQWFHDQVSAALQRAVADAREGCEAIHAAAWLAQRLSYEDGKPADGPRFRDAMVCLQRAFAGKPVPTGMVPVRAAQDDPEVSR